MIFPDAKNFFNLSSLLACLKLNRAPLELFHKSNECQVQAHYFLIISVKFYSRLSTLEPQQFNIGSKPVLLLCNAVRLVSRTRVHHFNWSDAKVEPIATWTVAFSSCSNWILIGLLWNLPYFKLVTVITFVLRLRSKNVKYKWNYFGTKMMILIFEKAPER